MTAAIRVEEVHKLFRRMAPGFQLRTLKSALLDRSLIQGLRPEETIPALRGVSFEVAPGEAFGVIGRNGSGKSTLLKLLVGMLRPSSGWIEVTGRVAALIELGAGFHPEISGRENIYINGAVLGMTRREIDERYDRIVEFSGLADFIDEPVKNYSSGMYVRLGFAVAIHTEPDVLLVDEVLAVGDEAFTHRCLRRIEEFLARGKTLLLVSHSLGMIEGYSDRVLWLDDGVCRLLGKPRFVVDAYRQAVAEEEGRGHREAKEERAQQLGSDRPVMALGEPAPEGEPAASSEGAAPAGLEPEAAPEPEPEAVPEKRPPEPEEELRWGSGEAEVTAVRLLDGERRERYYFESGEEVCFEIEVEARRPLADVVFGVGLFTPRGIECWGTNTHLEGYASAGLEAAATARVVCPALRLAPGEYLLDVAVHSREGYPYDYQRRVLSFTVTARAEGVGIYFPEHHWEFAGDIRWRERPDD
jgi:ABC-type polysaccharide/polyol phosphate transport system ATPase subunit